MLEIQSCQTNRFRRKMDGALFGLSLIAHVHDILTSIMIILLNNIVIFNNPLS